MQKPTIHLNGTSADSLLRDDEAAHDAVTQAISALAQVAPHGRDYYVQGAQHCQRRLKCGCTRWQRNTTPASISCSACATTSKR
jgi:hypothetical protein